MGVGSSSFTFDCDNQTANSFDAVFQSCDENHECPGLKDCLVDMRWEENFLLGAIQNSGCSANDYITELETIEQFGLCACDPQFGYIGNDCTTPGPVTYFLAVFEVFLFIGSLYTSRKIIGLAYRVAYSSQKIPLLLKVLVSFLVAACMSQVLFSILVLIDTFTPHLATIQGQGEKRSFVDKHLVPVINILLLLSIDASVLTLNFSWAKVLAGVKRHNSKKEQKAIAGVMILSGLTAFIFFVVDKKRYVKAFMILDIVLFFITLVFFWKLGKEIKSLGETDLHRRKQVWKSSSLLYNRYSERGSASTRTFNEEQKLKRMRKYATFHQNMRNAAVTVLFGCFLDASVLLVLAVLLSLDDKPEYAQPGTLNPIVLLFQLEVFGTFCKALGIVYFVTLCNKEIKTSTKSRERKATQPFTETPTQIEIGSDFL